MGLWLVRYAKLAVPAISARLRTVRIGTFYDPYSEFESEEVE
jgi:hypothetical protein